MSGRRGQTGGPDPGKAASAPTLVRFEVYVRVGVDGDALSMRVPDIHAVDGAEALRMARTVYGRLAMVRGIDARRG